MTQSRSADAIPTGAAQRIPGPAPAPRHRRVAWQLTVLIAIPAMLALALTGLWVTDATRSAGAYGQAARLAALGQQVTSLAQAMADERASTAAFISGGRPAAGLPALRRQYAITDGRAARVRRLVSQIGHGYPAMKGERGGGWGAGAAKVLASIAKLPGLRRQAAQRQASAVAVIAGYSAAAGGLFPVNDGIADASGNATLINSVRALGSLSRMIDHAAQQQAILSAALAEGRFGPGALTALTTAQARQASDLASFRDSAIPEESWALSQTLARPPARQAQVVEQRATAAGNGALAPGPQASQQWSAGMSYTVGWMRQAQRQLAGWITADAGALQRSAMRSAIIRGVAGLAAVALILLGTMVAARSMVRRRRRLDANAREGAGAHLPADAGAVPDGFFWRNHSLLERLLRLIDSVELTEDDPERLASLFEMDHLATRIWRNADSALALAGHETPRPARPLALVDVLRAAASEIEEYGRVIWDVQSGVYVTESAATDTVHLLAELLENATTFSPEATEVIVSGHAVCGGGSLITITDHGPGMSEEELALFNWQLANPAPADMAVARRMGLFAVALLAAPHGITVTLSTPRDGGTTAEVYLPVALISLDGEPGGWQGRTGEALPAWAGEEAGAGVADLPSAWAGEVAGAGVAGLPFSALRFASGPQPPLGPETDAPGAVPLVLGAPVPVAAPETATGMTGPGPVGAEPGGGPPIFESVRSGYPDAFGRGLLRFSEQQASPSPPSGLPQRVPQPGQVRGAAADQETRQAPVADPAEITRSKLASFQRGSHRARAAARMNRATQQPGQDG